MPVAAAAAAAAASSGDAGESSAARRLALLLPVPLAATDDGTSMPPPAFLPPPRAAARGSTAACKPAGAPVRASVPATADDTATGCSKYPSGFHFRTSTLMSSCVPSTLLRSSLTVSLASKNGTKGRPTSSRRRPSLTVVVAPTITRPSTCPTDWPPSVAPAGRDAAGAAPPAADRPDFPLRGIVHPQGRCWCKYQLRGTHTCDVMTHRTVLPSEVGRSVAALLVESAGPLVSDFSRLLRMPRGERLGAAIAHPGRHTACARQRVFTRYLSRKPGPPRTTGAWRRVLGAPVSGPSQQLVSVDCCRSQLGCLCSGFPAGPPSRRLG